MADWSRDKVDASNLNNGQEYTLDSDVSLEQLNAVVNNSLYAGDFVEELTNIDTTNINNVGEARVRVESSPNATPTKPYKRLVFENLKGEQGESGADGKSAYEYAQDGGFTGTEKEFIDTLGNIGEVAPAEPTKLGTVFGNTQESPNGATTLGYNARSTSKYAVAIGAGSSVDAQGAIQIGTGSNTIPNSATFGGANSPVNSLALYTTRNGVTGYHTVAFEEDINNSGGTGGTSSALPIGFVIYSSCKQNNAGLHLADGSELAIGGTYDAFCQYVINNQADFPITDLATYQTELDTYGQCGKYVITDTYVKLPKITKQLESANSESEFGTSLGAGLPNITGWMQIRGTEGWADTSGAFYYTGIKGGSWGEGHSNTATNPRVAIDASRSSSIYGNSNTVQPQTTKYYCYIVVATVTKTDIEVNIDNVATDLNNKATKNLSNVPLSTIKNKALNLTTLWEGSITSATTFSLSQSFLDFNFLFILGRNASNEDSTGIIQTSVFNNSTSTYPYGFANNSKDANRYVNLYKASDTRITIKAMGSMTLLGVYGL